MRASFQPSNLDNFALQGNRRRPFRADSQSVRIGRKIPDARAAFFEIYAVPEKSAAGVGGKAHPGTPIQFDLRHRVLSLKRAALEDCRVAGGLCVVQKNGTARHGDTDCAG